MSIIINAKVFKQILANPGIFVVSTTCIPQLPSGKLTYIDPANKGLEGYFQQKNRDVQGLC